MTAGESVLVTGVGGGVGQSIIKALAGSGLVMVGADADGLATGLQAVPVAYRVPRADDGAFIATLVDLCAREQCMLIFPGLDPELSVLAAAAVRFTEAEVTVVVSVRASRCRHAAFTLGADLPVYFRPFLFLVGARHHREYCSLIREYLPKGAKSSATSIVRGR